jgi:hypothetical protein
MRNRPDLCAPRLAAGIRLPIIVGRAYTRRSKCSGSCTATATGGHTMLAYQTPSGLLQGRIWLVLSCLVTAVVATSVRAQDNAIEHLTVVSENRDSVTFDIVFSYNGDHGDSVFMSAVMSQDGKTSANYAYQPGRVQRGRHRTQVTLGVGQGAPAIFSTNQVQVAMYAGGGSTFVKRAFFFPKTWSRAGAELPPVLNVIGVVKQPPAVRPHVTPGAGAAGGTTVVRRVLPNGHIELRLQDGTIRERFRGGETITRPDGSRQTVMYSSAQPPTPPSAVPDQTHAAWLNAENERLLGIIRTLVGNDDASLKHYLAGEGSGISPYQRIDSRTEAVNMLITP